MFESLRSMWTQFFPPAPTFTEEHVPSQRGRVFIVTGGNAGVGFELCKMLYPTGATIYMAARSQCRAEEAIKQITSAGPAGGAGSLKFLELDLNDLHSVARAADAFARLENRLDVLWNNAGPGAKTVPAGATTAQGLEPMMGMHCVATLFFTLRLLPLLRATAAAADAQAVPGATRVAWTTSYLAEGQAPRHGIGLAALREGTADRVRNYAVAKAGVWMLAHELAARADADADAAVLSVVLNPGNVRAGSYAGSSAAAMLLLKPLLHETRTAAYTGLFAGLAPDVARAAGTGYCYVVPWGRVRPDADCPRPDILVAMKSDEEGGLGYGKELWEWCEEQWKDL